jgi:hypothetical protein
MRQTSYDSLLGGSHNRACSGGTLLDQAPVGLGQG